MTQELVRIKLSAKETLVTGFMASNDGINRFEAIRIGDTCLNTTISALKQKGLPIDSEWEEIPTRFGKPARVKRYRLIKSVA